MFNESTIGIPHEELGEPEQELVEQAMAVSDANITANKKRKREMADMTEYRARRARQEVIDADNYLKYQEKTAAAQKIQRQGGGTKTRRRRRRKTRRISRKTRRRQ